MHRDLEAKIASTKANMKATTDAQLDATAKRTILENGRMGSELVYQARETGRMLDRNDALAAEHAAAIHATRNPERWSANSRREPRPREDGARPPGARREEEALDAAERNGGRAPRAGTGGDRAPLLPTQRDARRRRSSRGGQKRRRRNGMKRRR